MRNHRLFALALTGLGVLGVSVVSAQRDDARPRRLDAEVFTLRLLLGVDDRQTQTWSGRVALDQGEIVGVEGYGLHIVECVPIRAPVKVVPRRERGA